MQRIGRIRIAGLCLFLFLETIAWAQGPGIVPPPAATISTTQVIQFSGNLNGQPDGPLSITFSLYATQQSTSPLWTETQTVQTTGGAFTALLGANSTTGIPVDSFVADEAHWLGVQVNGVEQRYMLVSVPYAMKAIAADMLGGIPASQYVTATQLQTALQNLPPQPSTSFTGSNSSQVVLVTQQGNGFAIQGMSSGPVAILGENSSSGGTGIQGVASSTSGQNVGVLGQSASPAGIAGVFDNTGGGQILSLRSNGTEVAGVDQSGNLHAFQVQALNFAGSGFGLTNIPNSATTSTSANSPNSIVSRDSAGNFSAGQISALNFVGNGFGLTNIPNSATTATSANSFNSIVSRDSSGNFSAGQISALNFVGNGFGLTNVPPSAIGATPANIANSVVQRDNFGGFSAGFISAGNFAGDGSLLTNIQNSATTATSNNAPNTIVARDQFGNFTTGGLNVLNQLTSSGPVDFSGVVGYTAPIRAISSNLTPTNCVASRELLIKTDALPGQQLFICNSTGNGYILVGDGVANGVLSVSPGDSSVAVSGTSSAPTVSVANGGITSAKLASNAVGAANIADGSLPPSKIAGTAAILGPNIFTAQQTMPSLSVQGPVTASGAVTGNTVSANNGGFFGGPTSVSTAAGTALTVSGGDSTSPGMKASSFYQALNANSTSTFGIFTNSGSSFGLHAEGGSGGVDALSKTNNGIAIQANVTGSNGIAGSFVNQGTSGSILVGRTGTSQGLVFNLDTVGNLYLYGAHTVQYTNSSAGTTPFGLAKIDANGNAVSTSAGDTGGAVGVVTSGAGTFGPVSIAYAGAGWCLFDNQVHIGDYAQISRTTTGYCTDAGAVYPSSGQVVGRILQPGSGAFGWVLFFGPEQRALPGGTLTSINTGTGLVGGPITSSGTISIANAGVTNSMLQHNSVTVTAGTGLSGGGPVALGSSVTLNNTGALSFNGRTGAVAPASGDYSFAQLGGSATSAQLPATVVYNNQSNTFSAPQTVNGSVTATSFGGDGSALTNVNAASVGGLAPASLATAAALNTETSARQNADASLSSQISSVAAQSAQLNSPNAFTANSESFSGASTGSTPLMSIQDSGSVEALHVSSQGGISATFTNSSGGKLISGRSASGSSVTENFSVDTGGNIFSAGAVIQQYMNGSIGNGTTLGHLAGFSNPASGAPGLVVSDAAPNAPGGVIGVTVGGAGTSGMAQVAISGIANCVFDGPTWYGSYVGISRTVQGDCTSLGAVYPSSGQVIGRVVDPNTGSILLFGPEQRAGLGGTVSSVNTGGGLTGGPITSSGTISIALGGVTNSMLQYGYFAVTAGQGLSGGGSAWLGNSVTLTNTGVLSFNGRNGSVGPASGDYSFNQLSGSLAGSQMPALSGDVTSTAGSTATTLAPSGVTAGTYTKVTVDAKGRATSGAQAGFADLTGSVAATQMPAFSGDVTSAAGSTTTTLAATGVTAGTYTKVTVDVKGRATAGAQVDFADLTGTVSASQLPAAVVYNNQTNTFTGNQTVNGSVSATAFSGSGAAVTGVNAASLNGLVSSSFAQLSAANTFTGNQTVNGSVSATAFSGNGAAVTGVNAASLNGLVSSSFAQLGAANAFTAKQTLAASSTSAASLNVPAGTAPSAPAAGDIWNTGSVLQYRDNASATRSLVSTTQSGGMQLLKLTSSITPASVPVNSCSEQSFSVSGINTGDIILGVSQPSTSSPGTNIAIGAWRVSAANTVAIQFCNVGRNNSSTPVAGSYTFALMR